MQRSISTNEARKFIRDALNVMAMPDLATVKKYFTLVQGEDKPGAESRNNLHMINMWNFDPVVRYVNHGVVSK